MPLDFELNAHSIFSVRYKKIIDNFWLETSFSTNLNFFYIFSNSFGGNRYKIEYNMIDESWKIKLYPIFSFKTKCIRKKIVLTRYAYISTIEKAKYWLKANLKTLHSVLLNEDCFCIKIQILSPNVLLPGIWIISFFFLFARALSHKSGRELPK